MIKFFGFKGFTLAEVLITLGVIGIVAALTLPSVIINYQKKETVSRLKKVYSILYQSILMSEVDNGSIESWDKNGTVYIFFNKYLQPYIKNIQSISYDRNNMPLYKRPNGTIENAFIYLYQDAEILVLEDGSMMFLPKVIGATNTLLSIAVDLNGFNKPNIIGRDFFVFSVPSNDSLHKLVPYGAYNTSDMPFGDWKRENTQKGSYACSRQGRGQFCAALIMIDGWKIKKDYPW